MKILFLFLLSLNSLAKDYVFPQNFEFGVSNAAVQVEENSFEIWNKMARKGEIKAYDNAYFPHDKLRFWSEPEIEIRYAKELGVQVFRMGVDWQRIVPVKGRVNEEALRRYLEICQLIKDAGMKVMLTLFHHSEPVWLMDQNGWVSKESLDDFKFFSEKTFDKLNPVVDYWLTFNESNVYLMFTRIVGNWPSPQSSPLAALNLPFYKGDYFVGLENMAKAHNTFFNYAKKMKADVNIGIAHNTANYKSGGFLGDFVANWSWENFNYYFPDLVKDHLDFMGFNYYGSEYVSLFGLHFDDEALYNDAGRAIDPEGLGLMLERFYDRYKKSIFITENGTADEMDFFRPAYLTQHLKVIHQKIKKGIPILGYIQWSLTDNFEWADGYCPKFGLVAVDRKNNLKRLPRDSYYLYQSIIKNHALSENVLNDSWNIYKSSVGKIRNQCRAENAKDGLDHARKLKLKFVDFRGKDEAKN